MLRSACLFGLFHPAIYLPPQALGEDGAPNRYVLLHELTHYKRRDQLWCALRLLLTLKYKPDRRAQCKNCILIRICAKNNFIRMVA